MAMLGTHGRIGWRLETLKATEPDKSSHLKTSCTETYTASVTFNAPLDFAYAWCTDFQDDDPKMVGSNDRRHILDRSKRRVIWAVENKEGSSETDPIRVVWLRPPIAWHLETCGDKNEMGDYKLTPLGKAKTRLDMKFTVTYGNQKEVEDKESWEADVVDHWNKYGHYLENDFRHLQRK
jgi:hypothetical protein